jgi:UDP-glucose 4-epimerase
VDNIRRRVVNIEKARRALRWIPEVTLEEGLRRTVEWQRRRLFSSGGSRSPVA